MLESVWYGTSRSGERRTKWPYVSFSQRSLSSAISGLPFERLCRLRLTAEKVSGGEELGHGRLGPVGQLAVLQESRPPREEPGRLDARGHVGQHPLHHLVVPD